MTYDIFNQVHKHEQARPAIAAVPDAKELLAICQQNGILTTNRAIVHAIGERLNARGGIAEMRRILRLIHAGYPYGEGGERGWHPAEVEAAWNGIGTWVW